jgi:hypothetical protein
MNDKKHNSPVDGSQSDPPLLVFGKLVDLGQCTRVIENESRGLKANIVLKQILSILVLVPFKSHGRHRAHNNHSKNDAICQYTCMYVILLVMVTPTETSVTVAV